MPPSAEAHRGWRWFAVVAAVCGLTAPAYANPGAAAILATLTYFVFGTLVVCVLEAAIAKSLGAKWIALLVVPIANVISASVGWYVVSHLYDFIWPFFGETRLDAAFAAAWTTFLILALLGVLIEWPFFALCTRPSPSLKRAVRPLLAASLVSNAALALIALGWFSHGLSRYERATVAEVASEHEGPLPWVYFLNADVSAVHRVRLDGSGGEVVCEVPWSDPRPVRSRHTPMTSLNAIERGGEVKLVLSFWLQLSEDEAMPYCDGFGPEDMEQIDPHGWLAYVDLDRPISRASSWVRPHTSEIPHFFERAEIRASLRPPGDPPNAANDDYLTLRGRVYDPLVGDAYSFDSWTDLTGDLAVLGFRWFDQSRPPSGIMLVSMKSDRRAWLVEDGLSPVVVYHDEETLTRAP